MGAWTASRLCTRARWTSGASPPAPGTEAAVGVGVHIPPRVLSLLRGGVRTGDGGGVAEHHASCPDPVLRPRPHTGALTVWKCKFGGLLCLPRLRTHHHCLIPECLHP